MEEYVLYFALALLGVGLFLLYKLLDFILNSIKNTVLNKLICTLLWIFFLPIMLFRTSLQKPAVLFYELHARNKIIALLFLAYIVLYFMLFRKIFSLL